jgi:hypothetical protein
MLANSLDESPTDCFTPPTPRKNLRRSWKEIVSDNDGNGPAEFLDWSGLKETWRQNQLGEAGGSAEEFLTLAENFSKHLRVSIQNWGGNDPGISGTEHIISIDDESALRLDLRLMVHQMLERKSQT